MRLEEYPAQEPPSDSARSYGDAVMRLGAGLEGIERRYGADPYQSLAVFRAPAPNGTLLAFMHGGGWTNGYKEWMAFMAPAFTAAGVSFATIGYRLAPAHVGWVHDVEGPDDMPAHIKSMLNGVSLHVPVIDGALAVGIWQGIYVAEHRSRPHRRGADRRPRHGGA